MGGELLWAYRRLHHQQSADCGQSTLRSCPRILSVAALAAVNSRPPGDSACLWLHTPSLICFGL